MTKRTWKSRIKKCCRDAGTYQPWFDGPIDTLAEILEHRDESLEKYIQDGRRPVVTYTNKAGAENMVKNPLLQMILDCNAQALAYWKELGLTSRSWKTMGKNDSTAVGSLESVLAGLGI